MVHLQGDWRLWGHSLLPDAHKAKGLESCKEDRNGWQSSETQTAGVLSDTVYALYKNHSECGYLGDVPQTYKYM